MVLNVHVHVFMLHVFIFNLMSQWSVIILNLLERKLKKESPKKVMSWNPEAVTQGCCARKGVLWNFANTEENACVRVSFLIRLQALLEEKEALSQVFSCELCQISKNNFSYRTRLVATSGNQFTWFDNFIKKVKPF